MNRYFIVVPFVTVLAALGAAPAIAQIGNPAFMTPGVKESKPGTPTPGQLNTADRLFIKLFAMGNVGEIEAGKLADARGGAAVKGFGRSMVVDHSQTLTKLSDIARERNVAVPNEAQPDQKAAIERLSSLQGASFDLAYLQAQLIDHQKTVQLLKWEIGNGQDAPLQRLAMEALPTVLEHLRNVQTLIADHSGAGLQGLASTQAIDPVLRH